eukprot:8799639-Karenia_brevis.AAC.1
MGAQDFQLLLVCSTILWKSEYVTSRHGYGVRYGQLACFGRCTKLQAMHCGLGWDMRLETVFVAFSASRDSSGGGFAGAFRSGLECALESRCWDGRHHHLDVLCLTLRLPLSSCSC